MVGQTEMGYCKGATAAVDIVDTAGHDIVVVTAGPSMNLARRFLGAQALGNKIFAVVGWDHATVEYLQFVVTPNDHESEQHGSSSSGHAAILSGSSAWKIHKDLELPNSRDCNLACRAGSCLVISTRCHFQSICHLIGIHVLYPLRCKLWPLGVNLLVPRLFGSMVAMQTFPNTIQCVMLGGEHSSRRDDQLGYLE